VNFAFLLAEKPHLLDSLSRQEIKKLIAVEDTSPALLSWAYAGYFKAEDRSFKIWKGLLKTIANHKNTPPEILLKLSNHRRPEITKLAINHPSFPKSEKIVPVKLSGGKIARLYEEDHAEAIVCSVNLKIDDDFGYTVDDATFPKDDVRQTVTFVPFTARKKRVELRLKLPPSWKIEQAPAISFNLWEKFRSSNETTIIVKVDDSRFAHIKK
jgi:hypothetical protein